MPKKKLKPFKHFFVQDLGCFPDEFIVSVGLTPKEFVQHVKRSKDIKKVIRDDIDDLTHHLDDGLDYDASVSHFVHESSKGNVTLTVLFIEEWDRTKQSTAILIHELMHIIQFFLLEGRKMSKEREGPAYAMEYLYLEIMRELDKKWYSEGRK